MWTYSGFTIKHDCVSNTGSSTQQCHTIGIADVLTAMRSLCAA